MQDTTQYHCDLSIINAFNWTRVDFGKLDDIDEIQTGPTYDVDVPSADVFGGFCHHTVDIGSAFACTVMC